MNPTRGRDHILSEFDRALRKLRANLLLMASVTERSLGRAIAGLLERDDEQCVFAIGDDDEVDQFEKQVDSDGIDLLLRFQPVASDLRIVVSAMKLSSNLERIADQAVSIARKARKLNRHPALPETSLMKPMYQHASWMLRESIDAYLRQDVELSIALRQRDRLLDQMNAETNEHLIQRMAEDPEQLPGYLNLTLVARYLERVGDHATNIAEEAVYAALAEDIRHQPFPRHSE